MKTTQNTILITGGSAGIGLEMAKQFSEQGNHVIILGRNEERLKQAAAQLKNVTAIVCDVTRANDVDALVARVTSEHPKLNVLINNAGSVAVYKLGANANAFENASEEMLTNYLSVIGLTEKLLPLLGAQKEAAIVNVSSIVAFAPGINMPTYSASKAALHSYTQSLRYTLDKAGSAIKVFELMPPLVNTEFSQAIGGANGIPPADVASNLLSAIEKDEYEIHVGGTANIYKLFLSSPAQAMAALNQSR